MIPRVYNGLTTFRLWAPDSSEVALRFIGESNSKDYAMERDSGGYHSITLPCGHGQHYQYLVNDNAMPDPASAFQPEGVHGPSMVVDFESFDLRKDRWSGTAAKDLIIYELHVGTFTSAGTYTAAIDRLNNLVALGITAIELMPLAECPGRWNWGYDGVCLYAPNHNYGSPAELHAFIRACHERKLAVILDVVYNHLGPEGNYLSQFGPYFGSSSTPWGTAPAVSGKAKGPVRDFFVKNALYWVEQYGFDGLRLDAITTIKDDGPVHLANEISLKLHESSKKLNREILVIGETNLYRSEFLSEPDGALDAIWVDDIASALGKCIGCPSTSKSRTYRGLPDLLKALRQGYLFKQKKEGDLQRVGQINVIPLEKTVCYLQNHDLVGNRPHGKRVHHWATPEVQHAASALVILYPSIPLLFMGEEFSARTPFLFFADFSASPLRRSVERGRMREFRHINLQDTTSPVDPEAFFRSKLPALKNGNQETFRWYQTLIRIRKRWRKDGFLSTENLKVIKDGGKRITLKYTKSHQVRSVSVDLTARTATHFDPDTSGFISECML